MRVVLARSWPLLVLRRAAAAAHAPLIGIGEQHPEIFTDAAFAPLGISDARFVAVL